MTFGQPTKFAITAYHEPSGPQWGGFGRMAIDIEGIRIGDILDYHCSLFHAVDRFREVYPNVENLWHGSFDGLSNIEIFRQIDQSIYTGNTPENGVDYGPYDFLTNTGEMFDGFKTFIVCRPDARIHILYRSKDDRYGSASCPASYFSVVAEAFVHWFDNTVRTTAPPYFPIEPPAPQE